ncbi:hypothetical protein BegalDRAFT_3422 [Beggiatoa alba B18LD]|uniref:Uncharacterized protein n=1 Tax=Beggiatoa alba B18LD TaxID=395493 RepID=I3CKU5_9GAMM|nr:hypothetical protein [Beggiatoa alba]EIJ44238.1 hypothetical protein BegalDRAFT_3422 [Beggiatoa alba B18LD]
MRVKTKIHAIAGSLALCLIASFWVATLGAESFGSAETVIQVKLWVLYGIGLLIPCIIMAGATGVSFKQARAQHKLKRMPLIAMNGIFVLIPCAYFLYTKAFAGEFDAVFWLVQAVELVAGVVNITLLGLNLRDGLRLTRKSAFVSTAYKKNEAV